MTAIRSILPGLLLALSLSSAASAQPSGIVSFTGPGAELLPSTTFTPFTYTADESSWGFFDEAGVVGIVVLELTDDRSRAAFVSVTVDGGASWLKIDFAGVPGVFIDGKTIEFRDTDLPLSGAPGPAPVTLNGALTRSLLTVSARSFGQVKSLYSSRRSTR